MMTMEYGSIQIKSPEMLAVLNTVSKFSVTDLVFIVGEKSTGKTTLAQYIASQIFKNQGSPVCDGLKDFSPSIRSGIFTVLADEWVDILPQLTHAHYKLVEMPTLSERKADLQALAEFFLQVLSLMNNKPKVKLTEKALEKILQYGWPGQFSEFEATLEAAFMKAENGLIEPEFLTMGPLKVDVGIPIGMRLEDLERKYILQTLYFVHQNRTKAAEILGISIRTLRNKINQYRTEGYL